jgi:hypothetical protein
LFVVVEHLGVSYPHSKENTTVYLRRSLSFEKKRNNDDNNGRAKKKSTQRSAGGYRKKKKLIQRAQIKRQTRENGTGFTPN